MRCAPEPSEVDPGQDQRAAQEHRVGGQDARFAEERVQGRRHQRVEDRLREGDAPIGLLQDDRWRWSGLALLQSVQITGIEDQVTVVHKTGRHGDEGPFVAPKKIGSRPTHLQSHEEAEQDDDNCADSGGR